MNDSAETSDPVGLEITLKSGAQITAEVLDWTVTKTPLDWEVTKMPLSRLQWETPAGAKRRLVHVALDEVAAIVEIRP